MAIHICNLSQCGGRVRRIDVQGQSEESIIEISSQQRIGVWWSISITPAMKEAREVGGL
jgi:hypothetical protein